MWSHLFHVACFQGSSMLQQVSILFLFYFFSSTTLLLPTHLPPPSCTHAQSCNPVDFSPPGSSVHGLFQARILEWVAISFSIHSVLKWLNNILSYGNVTSYLSIHQLMWSPQILHKIFFFAFYGKIKKKKLQCLNCIKRNGLQFL